MAWEDPLTLWKGIGLFVGGYVLVCIFKGEVHAKNGMQTDTVYRELEPFKFWFSIAIYAGLTVALLTVF
jgi:hypothetical protein